MSRAREADDDLATTLPPSLTVDLPEPVHEPPPEEAVVALDEVAVTPVFDGTTLTTTSIEVDTDSVLLPVESDSEDDGSAVGPAQGLDTVHEPGGVDGPSRALQPTDRRTSPEGRWRDLVYRSTFRLVDLGDSRAVRAGKALDARIGAPLTGGTRFVPVLTRKGGVGSSTVATVLGLALADVRDDRVLAIDGNPDRGTLADRIVRKTRSSVRDIVLRGPATRDFGEFSAHVSRDPTGLDVLASDSDPMRSSAFGEDEYNVVADAAARHYAIVLTDCGSGMVHSVMRAILQRADSVVVVSGGSLDEAQLASETLVWLEANGHGRLVRNAVVALNTATQGTRLADLDGIEAHFRSRVRELVRIPYDVALAAGSVVRYEALRPFTRASARELAAFVVDGLVGDKS